MGALILFCLHIFLGGGLCARGKKLAAKSSTKRSGMEQLGFAKAVFLGTKKPHIVRGCGIPFSARRNPKASTPPLAAVFAGF